MSDEQPTQVPDQEPEPTERDKAIQRYQIHRDPHGGLILSNLQDMTMFAASALKTGLCPKGLTTAAQVLMVLQTGAELGMPPTQSLRMLYPSRQNRIELMSEGALGLCRGDPLMKRDGQKPRMEWYREWIEGEGEEMVAHAETKRREDPTPTSWEFSVADAKAGKVWQKKTKDGNDTAWVLWQKDMLLSKVRARLLKKVYPDVLGGLAVQGDWSEVQPLPPGPGEEIPIEAKILERAPQVDPLLSVVESMTTEEELGIEDAPKGCERHSDVTSLPCWQCAAEEQEMGEAKREADAFLKPVTAERKAKK